MSLRAIKKRENKKPYEKNSTLPVVRKFPLSGCKTSFSSSLNSAERKHVILGRLYSSNPDLTKRTDTFELLKSTSQLVQTKSESDVTKLHRNLNENHSGLISAKSEVSLKTISVHSTIGLVGNTSFYSGNKLRSPNKTEKRNTMLSGTRSHRDLLQSYVDGNSGSLDSTTTSPEVSISHRRRMSENIISECSRSSSSANTIGANTASQFSDYDSRCGFSDSTAVRVPIIGYEVMEERARFTVYKLRVENPFTNDCWLVLRRYTDFVRLNTKLKQTFPAITLHLPRKKIFGDNFNSVFLDNRVQGLQMFVNSIMANEELRKFKMVREFFCLDEPPTYSESMEECRAIFEAQEETIAHLKLQINSKNDLILSLQQKLRDEIANKEDLRTTFKNMSVGGCPRCTPNGLSNVN